MTKDKKINWGALRCCLTALIWLPPLTAFIITGSFVVETTFSIPGLGKLAMDAISNRDHNMQIRPPRGRRILRERAVFHKDKSRRAL